MMRNLHMKKAIFVKNCEKIKSCIDLKWIYLYFGKRLKVILVVDLK